MPLVGQRFVIFRGLLEPRLCLAACTLLACLNIERCCSSTGEGSQESDGDYLGEIHVKMAGGPKGKE